MRKKVITAFVLAVGIVSSIPTVVSVANTVNRAWTKYAVRGVWTNMTNVQRKDTSSSVYFAYTSGGASNDLLEATIYASHTENGTFERISYNGKLTPVYNIYKGQGKYMVNYVKETGRNYARITARPNNTATFGGNYQVDLN